ncbi:Anti-sigma-B factor antagonist [Streptomyces sp. YIM 130001]|uniref:STAS domain-containing protein n=1 Tax=Streptomyces sp. YIM 130001 TaxID=2259644 RepID=UPI000E653598|nr:STAS domain-containing protein [Streptomyces sp. YIM 130001]RII09692.1 Anti-sigma-B factor antagonist [Streptomyces sp. YIM 130001]
MPLPEVPYAHPHLVAYRAHGRTVLELAGEIDIAAALAIGPRLDRMTAVPEPLVVLDLTPTTFFDCSGLRMLHRAHRRITDRHGDLRIVCPHRLTRRLIAAAGPSRLPTVHTTLTAALPPSPADHVGRPTPPHRTG